MRGGGVRCSRGTVLQDDASSLNFHSRFLQATTGSLHADLLLEHVLFVLGFLHLCHSRETRVGHVTGLDRRHHLN